ncbi:MAG: undecaprenyl-phosphate glucose phosphotransferase [Rhodospirillaceae bacterium]|nr:MAG: undecaprenyl-phosphate glucose phosphotransferase [Rhodospirillaceae bacterium]
MAERDAKHDLRRGKAFSPRIAAGLFAIGDGLAVFLTGLFLYLAYLGWNAEDKAQLYVTAMVIQSAIIVTTFYFLGLYGFDSLLRHLYSIKRIILSVSILFLVLIGLAFALKLSFEYSRIWFFSWYLLTVAALSILRGTTSYLVRSLARAGKLTRNLVIVGGGEQGVRLLEALEKHREPWIRILGFFDDRTDRIPCQLGNHRLQGNLDGLIEFSRHTRVDEVLIAIPWEAENRLLDIFRKLKVIPARIRLSPDKIGLNPLFHNFDRCCSIPMLDIFDKPISDWNYVLKIIEDRVAGAVLLAASAPIMLLIAIVIKTTSPGPVLFRQQRYGFNNQLIEVYKFRTMHHGQTDQDASKLVTKGDSRVTPFGAFLRRTSLDELPQFFNVLQGNMSIVGPRPHALQAKAGNRLYEEVVSQYASRHKVKPGITGWAQVSGWRGETDNEEKIQRRLEHDLHYIENWSLLFDLRIILRTILVLFKNENAY